MYEIFEIRHDFLSNTKNLDLSSGFPLTYILAALF